VYAVFISKESLPAIKEDELSCANIITGFSVSLTTRFINTSNNNKAIKLIDIKRKPAKLYNNVFDRSAFFLSLTYKMAEKTNPAKKHNRV